MRVKLRPAQGQGEPIVVAARDRRSCRTRSTRARRRSSSSRERCGAVHGDTFQLDLGSRGYELISSHRREGQRRRRSSAPQPVVAKSFDGVHLQDVASQVGLDFRQDDFRFGVPARRPLDDGRRSLLARLQQRRLARPLRRQLVLGQRHREVERPRRPAAERALRERARASSWTSAPRRTRTSPCRGTAASPSTLRRRLHRPAHHDEHLQRAALEQRQRDVHEHHARGRHRRLRHVRLAHRRGGGGRERRRPARHLRLRLRRRERAGRLRARVPAQLPGVPRSALPQRGARRRTGIRASARCRRRRESTGRRPTTASAPSSPT